MPRAHLGFFSGSQCVDFSALHPDTVGVLLEFRTVAGETLALTISDADADQLLGQLDALLDDITNKRNGLPITPELWETAPLIVDADDASFDDPTRWTLAKGDPHETARTDAHPPESPAPSPHPQT